MSHRKEHDAMTEACQVCAEYCQRCATACLREPHVPSLANCIRLDLECVAICRLAVDFMLSGSQFADAVCKLCAEICEACADECAGHDHDHCQQCARACTECAARCRGMAGVAG